ncbi:hypothetical protein CRG98_041196 [Punica granatum]|uniref:Uncharacterized protein n=1 Tax=Punica granatum TaxID=22663 RepID=A0A2I0I4Q2_PUNGR|nr:hypothetical protein CRG98_041196 [Punica granatum]
MGNDQDRGKGGHQESRESRESQPLKRHPVLANLHRWLGMVAQAGSACDTSQEGAGGDYGWLGMCGNLR